jgi:hypothetical protein
MAKPFDVHTLTTTGDVFPVAEQIRTQSIGGSVSGIFAVSDAGVLAFQSGPPQGNGTQLMWVDRAGRAINAVGERGEYAGVELSPDGRQSVVSVLDRSQMPAQGGMTSDVWLFDLARGARTRLTTDPAFDFQGIWSPDGTQLVFASIRRGAQNIYRRQANGAGGEEIVVQDGFIKTPVSWSADGKYIVYYRTRHLGRPDAAAPAEDRAFWAIPAAGGQPFLVLASPFLSGTAQLSHDGRWLVYVSTESGRSEVYVAPFHGSGKTLVSTAGGVLPRWRRDGKEIFYRTLPPDTRLMSAPVSPSGSTLQIGAVRPLFSAVLSPFQYAYDVSADGERFLLNTFNDFKSAPDSTQSQVTVVVNWPAAGHESR